MAAKVCVLAVDAMEPTLITQWIDSGHLPNLARLRERGVSGPVLNPPRFFSGASWPNFYTGQVPARHDQYLRTLYDPILTRHEPLRPSSDEADAFWLSTGWRTSKTAVLNLPYCPPDARLNGVHIVDSYSHDRDHTGPTDAASAPESDAVAVSCYTVEPTVFGFSQFRDRLLQRIRDKAALSRRVLAADQWNLFMTGIDECHCAGHQLWHLHDTAHPRHDPAMAAKLGDPIKDIYVEIDRGFGSILNRLGSDTRVLFLSSHGMGPAFDGNAVLDEVLRRIEGLAPREPGEMRARVENLARWRRLLDRLPQPLRRVIRPVRRRFGRGRLVAERSAEARGRKCFWLPTHDLHGGIRINLSGREASGLVRPGAEYEQFVAKLIEELHELRDVRTGEAVVGDVVRAAEVDPEGYAGERPDLIVRWRRASFSAIESPRVGRIESTLVYGRTGDHPPEMRGMFFAAGPRLGHIRLANAVRLEDFAPTISRWSGVDLTDTAGSIIAALCEPAGAEPDEASSLLNGQPGSGAAEK
jgi:predicted AlkP superfamily phosphohydrolase/phosphomutase